MQSRRHMRDDHQPRNRLITGAWLIGITAMSIGTLLAIAWTVTRTRPEASLWGIPPVGVLLAAAAVLAAVLVGAVILEAISLIPMLRVQARGPDLITPDVRAHSRITVVIPAHNEEATLPATLAALRDQERPPDHVVVVADNCADRTGEIARTAGCTVLETHRNRGRKAGALNQALARLLPTFDSRDLLLIMDADTRLTPGFLEESGEILDRDGEVSAVGGVFVGDARPGMLAQLQRNEFARYARQLESRRGRVFVLTGTATLFRPGALEEVASQRGQSLPGMRGKVYAESAITEDNELTLALKSLGA